MLDETRAQKHVSSPGYVTSPLRVETKLISHAIEMGPFQTFDFSQHYANCFFSFGNDVLGRFSQFYQ